MGVPCITQHTQHTGNGRLPIGPLTPTTFPFDILPATIYSTPTCAHLLVTELLQQSG